MSANNEGTPTPLTDAQMARQLTSSLSWGSRDAYELADFARQLERDLAATKQRLEVAEKALDGLVGFDVSYDENKIIIRCESHHGALLKVGNARASLHPSADKAESNEDKS